LTKNNKALNCGKQQWMFKYVALSKLQVFIHCPGFAPGWLTKLNELCAYGKHSNYSLKPATGNIHHLMF
jgi:hypothetical protein